MSSGRKPRGADLTPEQIERAEAVRRAARTPEARAHEAEVRAQFADRPDHAEMVRRGLVDPSRRTTQGAVAARHRAVAAARHGGPTGY
jgi:hypothetical protein